jgi:histidine-containing phosphotransfer protein
MGFALMGCVVQTDGHCDCRLDREFSDYKKMGIHLNQFMGSSSSIGAKRVRNVCVAFRAASEQNNRAG